MRPDELCALLLQARVHLPASRALPQVHLDQGPLRQSDLTGGAQIERGRYAELHNVLAMVPKSIAYRLRENSDPERDPRFAR